MIDRTTYTCLGFFMMVILSMVSMLIASGATFLIGGSLSFWQAPLAFCITIFWGIYKHQWEVLKWFVVVVVVALLLGFVAYDYSYDSLTYHKPCIELLASGWNPVYDGTAPKILWIRHYARGQEMLAAVLIGAGIPFEASKAVNLMFFCGVTALLYASLRITFTALTAKRAWIVTAALMCNPAVLSQLFTFYNDQYLYSEAISLCALATIIWNKRRERISGLIPFWLMAGGVTVLAVNTKFTHFFFASIIWLVIILLYLWKSDRKLAGHAFVTAFVSVLAGLLLVGFNPYITNWITTGDPLYPLLSGKVDIMTNNTPDMLKGLDRVTAFLKAQLSTPDTEWGVVLLKISPRWLVWPSYDARILGFGSLFIPIILVSLLLLWQSEAPKWAWIASAMSLIPILFFAQSWWARYVPMPWAIGGLAILASYLHKTGKAKGLRIVLIAMIIITATIAFSANFISRLIL